MWVLPRPDAKDAPQHLDIALTYADGTPVYAITEQDRAHIQAVYNLYDQVLGQAHPSFENPPPCNECSAAIYEAYGEVQKGGRLRSLRESLMINVSHCPMCGFGEIRHLDHFLPRGRFRSLSIYVRNLVPTCDGCNDAKRAFVAEGDQPRLIHAYFTNLPQHRFFKARASLNDGALNITFNIDAQGLSPGLADALNFQLTRMKLNERYPKQINKYLFELRPAISAIVESAPGVLRDFLLRSAMQLDQDFGANDWRSAVLSALAECDDFCSGGYEDFYRLNPIV